MHFGRLLAGLLCLLVAGCQAPWRRGAARQAAAAPSATPAAAFKSADVEAMADLARLYAKERGMALPERSMPDLLLVPDSNLLSGLTGLPEKKENKVVMGACWAEKREIYVVKRDLHAMRRTLAHEIGHYVLGVECEEADRFMEWVEARDAASQGAPGRGNVQTAQAPERE